MRLWRGMTIGSAKQITILEALPFKIKTYRYDMSVKEVAQGYGNAVVK